MAVNKIEPIERKLFSKPLWFSRPNIRFEFNHKGYENGTFGTRVGPTDSLIEAGLHELAHCVDFVLTGKLDTRLHYDALEFQRPYANAICIHGKLYDDFPQSARGSWSEIRTNAIQALLIQKAFGTGYCYVYANDEDHLIECDVETMLRKSARSLWVLDDASNFSRTQPNGTVAPISELYFDAMMKHYNQIDTPFGTQRIVRALDRVNTRLGKLHAAHESDNGAKS